MIVSMTFVTAGGCLPNDYFVNLAGSTLSQIIGVVVSDVVNTAFPPV